MSRHGRRRAPRTEDAPTPDYPAALIVDLDRIDRRYPNGIPAVVALFKAHAIHRHLHADAPADGCDVCELNAEQARIAATGATHHDHPEDDDDEA
jgi:hypothetical protein